MHDVHRMRLAINLKYDRKTRHCSCVELDRRQGHHFEAIIAMESTGAKQAREKSVNPAVRSTSERACAGSSARKFAAAPESQIRWLWPALLAMPRLLSLGHGRLPHLQVAGTGFAHRVGNASVLPPRRSPQPAQDRQRARTFAERAQVPGFRFPHSDQRRRHFPLRLEHQHTASTEPAAVCHSCYGEVRQQADRMEAALHMDAKEAAKIVYEAVWADTSDPEHDLPERRHGPVVGVAQARGHRPPARRKSAPGALASSH